MKKFATLLLVFFLFLVVVAAIRDKGFFDGKTLTYSNMTREKFVRKEPISVTLIITDGDNSRRFDTKADQGDSAFNLLRTVAAKENISLETDEDLSITSINGSEGRWIYLVNGEIKEKSPDEYVFIENDVVEFMLQK